LIKNCWAVEYKRYYVSDYYTVVGDIDKMKSEIYKYGPIACAIEVTDDFDLNYKAG
jgi:hypothetical protein